MREPRPSVNGWGLGAVLFLLFSSAAGAQPTPLSLSRAIELALEQNPAMVSATAAVEAGEARVTQARAPMLPRLDFIESATRSDNPVFVFGSLLNQRRFTGENFALEALNDPSPLNLFQSRFVLEQTLFAGGRNRLRLERARLGENGAREGRRQAEMNVIFGVVSAYYGVLVAEANLGVVTNAERLAGEDLERAQALFETGMATEADVLSLRVHAADLEEQRIVAESLVAIQRAELNQALGEPLDRDFSLLTELTTERAGERETREPGTLEDLALSERPEMRQAGLELETASIGHREAKSAFLPSVALHGGWESDRESFLGSGGTNWMLGLSLRFNLFNGLADRGRMREAQAELDGARARQQEVENRLRLEVRRAFLELTAARGRLEVAGGAVDRARESHRITQARYEGGLANVTDLLRSQNALLAAQARQLSALYESKLAEVGLELATGTLDASSEAIGS